MCPSDLSKKKTKSKENKQKLEILGDYVSPYLYNKKNIFIHIGLSMQASIAEIHTCEQ